MKGRFQKCLLALLILGSFLKPNASLKAQASIGIYESYVILNLKGAGNTFYDLNAATANTDFQGANLGTFTQAQTLVLAGAQNKTFKCNGGNVTGGNVYYRVYSVTATPGSFNAAIAMSFVSNDAGGCGGNQTWQIASNATNVKAGLNAGIYYLEVYTEATGSPATVFSNNGGANYIAQFTVTGGALYNFTAGTAAVATNTTGCTVSNMTSNNNNGTVTAVSSTSPSSGYTGASGTNNIGNAAVSGTLNTTTSSYFEFTLTPPTSGQVVLSGISFGSRGTGTAPTNYAIRTSADNYATNAATGTLSTTSTWALVSPTLTTVTGAANTALTIRIYGFGGTGAAANTIVWRLDDINVTSSIQYSPSLAVSSSTLSFGTSQAVGSSSTSQSINLSGSFLTGAPGTITVSAPSTDFQVSNNNSTWGATTTISYSTATLASTAVYVRFTPQTAGAKSGNVTFSGGGVTSTPTVAVSGTGVTPPSISSITASAPGSGTSSYIGGTVTIAGAGLSGVTAVKIGGSTGTSVTSFTVVNDATITFTAIAASGNVYVENAVGNATSSSSYTNNGYITNATGTWQTAATWLGGAVPPSATTTPITIAHNVTGTTGTINVGTLTVNTGVTLTNTAGATININSASTNSGTITNNGTIGVAVTYTNSGTFTIGNGGTFQLNSGGFLTGTALSYNATASTLAFNSTTQYGFSNGHVYWPSANGPVTVSLLNGSGGMQIQTGATRSITNLLLAAPLDIQSANLLTVSGTLTVNNGGFITTNSPVYTGTSTLLYNSVTGYGVNFEWTGNATTVGAGTPQNVTITSSSVNLPTSARSLIGNLSIGSGSTLTLSTTSGSDLNLSGNWTNSGTFTHNSRAVQFRGASAQTITGATTFAFLTINNTAGVTLANAVTISNQLDLTAGKVTLGTNNLTISSGASIINASSSSYVATTSTGQLLRTVAATATSFPVGNSSYNPFTLTNSGTSDTYGVRVADAAITTAFDNTKTVSRQWIVTETVAGGSTLTASAQYNTGETNTNYNAGTNNFIGFYNGTSWSQASATATGSNPFVVSASATLSPANLTTGTQYFALGKDNAFLSVAANLVITAISPASPTEGSGFTVTVRSQDAYGAFANVSAATAFSLTTNGNGGSIGGTITGTISSATSTVTVSGVTLSTAGTGVTLTATRTSGDVLTAGTSTSFTVLQKASQLAFVGVPATGSTGTNLTSFTVEARRPDNSLDNTYSGNITISKASGPGALSGTLTVAAVAGVATFSAAQFDAAGTYTLSATSGTLTSATSSSIVVSLAPVTLATYTFTGTACSAGALAASGVVSNVTFSTASATGQTCNNNSTTSYSIGGSSWGTAFSTGKYAEVTVTPASGYTININTLSFDYLRSAAGATNSTVRSSIDNYASDLVTAFTVGTGSANKSITLGGASFTGLSGAVTFRIYGWGGNSTGDFRLDNITFTGNVICLQPTAYSVTGGGSYTCGGAGVAVGLSGSQSGVNYQLTLNGSNIGSPIAGTGSAISFGNQTGFGTYAVVGSNTNGTCSLTTNMTGTAVVSYTTNTWTGSTNSDWSNAANWSCGSVPASGINVIVSSSASNMPVLAANTTIGSLTLNGSTTVDLNGYVLTINGAVSGTGTITGSHTSSLTIAGTADSLNFTQSGTGNYLKNLTINTGASATLGNALNITAGLSANNEGTVTVSGTGVLSSAGFLTLKSNQYGTASVGIGSTAGGYITGNVTVERYIPQNSSKAWRLLASNTSGSQSINAAWQEGSVGPLANPNTGFGTMIPARAFSYSQNLSLAQAAGFDTLALNHSLYKYDAATDNLVAITNTLTTALSSEHGYFLFVRGDRSPYQSGTGAPTTSTTLRSKGSLYTGDQTAVTTGASDWALVRNPYASRIDMRNIVRSGALVDAYQVWDPKLGGTYGVGGYQTFTKNNGTGNYEVSPGGGSFGSIGSVYNYIESGNAFYIQSSGGSGSAQVVENCKVSGSSLTFRPSNPTSVAKRIYYTLTAMNTGNSTNLVDGGYADFDDVYSSDVNNDDVRKSPNFAENFGLIRNGTSIVVERRANLTTRDTLFFDMNTLKNISYRIDLSAVNMDPSITTAFLEDRFTGSSTMVDLSGGTTSYTFAVNSTAGTFAANRFRLVFRQGSALPVSIVRVAATAVNRSAIRVDWNVAVEQGVNRYEVERSADGRSFIKVGEKAANNATAYNFTDNNVSIGNYFYRIRSVDNSGSYRYSVVVKVSIGAGAAGITVSPNPISGNTMNLQLSNQAAGSYGIRLVTLNGQTVYKAEMQHAGGSVTESLNLPKGLTTGQYQLEVIAPGNNRSTQSVIIQ